MRPVFVSRRIVPNMMADSSAFLRAWDTPAERSRHEVFPLSTSPYGNINDRGKAGCYDAPDLTPHHPQFHDAIEPGVRDLVLLLVESYRWVTYSSCQGHQYPGLPLPSVERHVGILPRDESERARILNILAAAVSGLTPAYDQQNDVRFVISLDQLEDEHGTRRHTVELWFAIAGGWSEYFTTIDQVYGYVVTGLRELAPRR